MTKSLFNALTYIQYNDNNLTWIFSRIKRWKQKFKKYMKVSAQYSLNYIVVTIINIFTCRRQLTNIKNSFKQIYSVAHIQVVI